MPTESQEIIRKFTKRLTIGIGYHRELLLAVHLKRHQASLETMLAEQFTFNSAVLWEGFLSDILLAYVVRNPAAYLKVLKSRVSQSLKDRYGSEVVKCAALSFPPRVTRSQARALIDPKQFNITVESASGLSKKANELLAATYAKKFTLSPEDAQFIDYIVAVRNYLGHRSTAARASLKSALRPLGGINVDFQADIRDVGVYLKQRDAVGETRAVTIALRLTEVAGHLQ